jgi:hypothetical protein
MSRSGIGGCESIIDSEPEETLDGKDEDDATNGAPKHGASRHTTVIRFGRRLRPHMSHPVFKTKLNAHSMCAQESSLLIYRTKNGYRITNVTIYNIFTQ